VYDVIILHVALYLVFNFNLYIAGWLCKVLWIDRLSYKASVCWQNCSKNTSCQATSKREGIYWLLCETLLFSVYL